MFVNGQKWSDVVEDCERFLKIIEELKPYIIELNKDSIIKDKEYLFDCTLGERI